MNLNATLLGEMITFLIFVWFTMKFVWPQLLKAIEARQQTIADGLAAAEQGQDALQQAKTQAQEQLKEAGQRARTIIEQAEKRASQLVEEAKVQSRQEAQRITDAAKINMAHEVEQAKLALREQVATIAVQGASKILKASLDESQHAQLLNDLSKELT